MDTPIYFEQFASSAGPILLGTNGSALTHLLFAVHKAGQAAWAGFSEQPVTASDAHQAIIALAKSQLLDYFEGSRQSFDLPLAPSGTKFQHKVWSQLQTIPYGETWSYQQLAESIGKPTASRAVGMANGLNPIGIVIPCHRVIGKSGKLTGYAGGIENKAMLLELEAGSVQPRLTL